MNLKQNLLEQQTDPVNAIIDSVLLVLKAKNLCLFRLKDFQEDSHQNPILESKYSFITRVKYKIPLV